MIKRFGGEKEAEGSLEPQETKELRSPARDANIKMIFVFFFLHFTTDFYNSFVNPLLPVFAQKFSLTLAQVGLIGAIARILSFVVQPSVGYLADRYRTRLFVLGGPLLSMIFIPLTGLAPHFFVLIFFVALGATGVSMFHPTSAGMVSEFAGSRFASSMAFYNFGGTLAFGCGPLVITYVVAHYGLQSSFLTMSLGLPMMLLLFRKVPLPAHEGMKRYGFFASLKEVFGDVWKGIAVLWVLGVARSFVYYSFVTFVPVLYSRGGASLVTIGWMVSLFSIGGAISGLLGGFLADRVGYKLVFHLSYALSVPALYLLLFVPKGALVFAFLTGSFTMATIPLFVVMAQDLAPRGKAMASSLMGGFAYGIGGMMTPLTGKLADLFGIQSVLSVVALIPILMMGLVHLLPGTKSRPGL
jgi:FSR family fosmidomycin resistance protein-like MFS transporter